MENRYFAQSELVDMFQRSSCWRAGDVPLSGILIRLALLLIAGCEASTVVQRDPIIEPADTTIEQSELHSATGPSICSDTVRTNAAAATS